MTTDTLVVCADAVDPQLLKRWEDDLENLTRIRTDGVDSELRSTLPAVTGIAWPTIMTGKTPGKTGVSSFINENKLISRKSIQSRCIWELADDAGLSVCSVNVPVSYPPDELDHGVIVSGMMTPGDATDWVSPATLVDNLPKPEFDAGHAPKDVLLSGINRRTEFALDLLNREEWDIFITTFMETDRGGHSLLLPTDDGGVEGYDDLKEIYVAFDQALGRILAAAEPQNVIILSDHGFGRCPTQFVNMHHWFEERGYLKLNETGPTVSKERVERLLDTKGLAEHIPKTIRQLGRRLLPSERTTAKDATRESTATYEENPNGGGVRILNSDATTINTLISDLRSFSDPSTGENVFNEVVRRDELYAGPFTDQFPDILVFPNERYHPRPVTGGTTFESIPTNSRDIVVHRRNGVFLAAGEAFDHADSFGGPIETWDVMPTLCHLLNIPVPEDVDGVVRTQLFAADSDPRDREVTTGSASELSSSTEKRADDEEVRERLEDLGYL